MPQKTFKTRVQTKRDTATNWELNNPLLLNGEEIIVDTAAGEVRKKVGDGVKRYTQLPFTDEKIKELINEKVSKDGNKVLSDNNFTITEKNKLAGIAEGANKYVHPTSHAATMIIEDTAHRFVTDTEKSTWNSKAAGNHTHNYAGSATVGGSANSAVKLDTATAGTETQPVYFKDGKPVAIDYTIGKSVPTNALFTDTVYTHPDTHPATMITEDTTHRFVSDTEKSIWNNKASTATATQTANGLMSSTDKKKLDGVAEGANKYVHPASHAATMITEDTTHRFITDAEKATWNAKASTDVATITANGLMSSDDKTKLDGIAEGANKYVHPTTAGNKHIPSGGASGQILKYSASGTAVWANEYSYTHPNSGVTAGTYKSVTVDAKGHVTGGTNPTTLSGYGITDAAAKSHNHDGVYLKPSDTVAVLDETTGTSTNPVQAKAVVDVFNTMNTELPKTFAPIVHNHDDRYYSETEMDTKLAGKSNTGHKHVKADITDFPASMPASDVSAWAKAATKPTYTASEVGADASGAAAGALTSAKSYTDTKISDLINGAPTTLDTLKEIADAMATNDSVVDALEKAVGNKADSSLLTSHTTNTTVHITSTERNTWNAKASTAIATQSANGLMSLDDKKKLDGIATGANKYVHPSTHAATMITEDSTHRFTTDIEKDTWNNKVIVDNQGVRRAINVVLEIVNSITLPTSDTIKVSPNMGLKIQ